MVRARAPGRARRAACVVLVAVVGGLTSCGRAPTVRGLTPDAGDHVVTLYRDRAVIVHHVEVHVRDRQATVSVALPIGITVEDIAVLDRGGLTIEALRGPPRPAPPPDDEDDEDDGDDDEDDEDDEDDGDDQIREVLRDLEDDEDVDDDDDDELLAVMPAATPAAALEPTSIELVVSAPRPGRYAVRLGYVTSHLAWEVAYTMTTTPGRDRVTVRGGLAIHNTTKVEFRRAQVRVVDAELGASRARATEQLAGARTRSGPAPRSLGRVDLVSGDTRIELFPEAAPRPLRAVLVFDPVGPALDHLGPLPVRAASLGQVAKGPVTESFAIARIPATDTGLPAGPVRLLERRADGGLDVRGETRLFDARTQGAADDTITIGVADGVTAQRERREFTLDDERKRIVEEFVVTITNARAVPVEVVIREHLYRGQNWSLAYHTGDAPTKEGPQQISLRASVSARSETRVLVVVVYTWP